jgi:hypothetical protein
MGAIFYTITTLFIRLSIGFYLLRICLIKVHLWIIKITMAIMTVFTIVTLSSPSFNAVPSAISGRVAVWGPWYRV